MNSFAELETALLAAHSRGDTARLIDIYRAAGEMALETGETDRGCFFLTHAYVFALEAGTAEAKPLHELLIAHGREE